MENRSQLASTNLRQFFTSALFVLLVSGIANFVPARDGIRVEHDAESLTKRIEIASRNGRVAWSDALRGISRARGFDDEALDGVLPEGTFRLESTSTRLQLIAYNLVLSPHVAFKVAGSDTDNPRLVITIDEVAMLASRRRLKQWLRGKLTGDRLPTQRSFGIAMDDGWRTVKRKQPVVIAIHGMNSDAASVSSLLAAARRNDFACGTFQYPNDQPIEQSARLLANELHRFHQQHRQRRVALVTHSMGGLVARAAVEDPALDLDYVEQLIMIAPPNQGSVLAECNFGLDVWEHALVSSRRERANRFYAAIEDGLSEAAHDLRPGSRFLRDLNARSRNPRVRYSIILGTRSPLTEQDRAAMHDTMERAGDRNRWTRFFGARVLAWTADLEEVVDGKGDGLVAVKRGRLDGVEDIVTRRFGHIRVLNPNAAEAREVHKLVLDRLRENPPR